MCGRPLSDMLVVLYPISGMLMKFGPFIEVMHPDCIPSSPRNRVRPTPTLEAKTSAQKAERLHKASSRVWYTAATPLK